MLTFDKLKIVSKIENIEICNHEVFEQTIKNNNVASLKYKHINPCALYIEIDYLENELVIEFSGKILGRAYKKLISKETIKECFENINNIGVCLLDTEAIMEDAVVVKCDVTCDVPCDDVAKVTAFIRGNISNYNQYTAKRLRNGNFIVEKNVTTRQYKKRLTIYDKDKEMRKNENMRFMRDYGMASNAFENLCRFEMNLNSQAQIRSALNVPDTMLLTVLNAEASPIEDFMYEVVADNLNGTEPTDRTAYITELVLRDCGYDLAAVEAKMRTFYAKGTNLSKVMKPYREALAKTNTQGFNKDDLLQMLQNRTDA